ncbi:restriction endonuclease subunit S [Companilactobacillus futsaii]|uniref:restriction endonuclease subunit S n=1 Tax=Companilactobacillus futsaii TaxID=938155 RepID=UPI00189D2B00
MSNKVPQIRFNGYSDAWVQHKLVEIADYRNGKAHEKDISEDGDYIVVNSKFVSTNGAVKKYSNELIAPLKKGELAFVLSDVPNGRAIARTFLIDEDNKYSLNQRIAGITPHSDTNSYFLHSLMNRHHYFLRFDDRVGQTNLSKKEVENWTELYPSVEEQQKIGTFFQQLDNLITLHQRKLAKLKELKQGYLQKMFPKNGSKFPQLRFAGFADDWEERKLGELSNIVGGGTPSTSNSEYWDGDIDWYAPAEIGEQRYVSKSKKTITELGLKKSSARILPVGTVLFTSRAGIGNTAILGKEATTNQGFQSIVPNPNKLDSYFIYSRTNELKRYGEVTGAGSTFVEVSGKQMSKMSIMVPELSEQKKIGSFFEQLDNTIALHKRKLDLLKEQKKGFLQKMFV